MKKIIINFCYTGIIVFASNMFFKEYVSLVDIAILYILCDIRYKTLPLYSIMIKKDKDETP